MNLWGSTSGEKFRNTVFVTVAVSLLVLFFLFMMTVYWMMQNSIEKTLEHEIKYVKAHMQAEMDEKSALMRELIENITKDQQLATAMAQQDRAALAGVAIPWLNRLNADHGIGHLYFITPQKDVFLRAHDPGRFGENVQHLAIKEAERTGAMASKLELGIYGELALRMEYLGAGMGS